MHACGKGFTHINYTKYHYGSGDPLPCEARQGRERGGRGGGGGGREARFAYTKVDSQEANYT